jgi:hypothetical protein
MRTSFHYQPEAQHPNSSAIHKPPADYPIFREELPCSRHHSRRLWQLWNDAISRLINSGTPAAAVSATA